MSEFESSFEKARKVRQRHMQEFVTPPNSARI